MRAHFGQYMLLAWFSESLVDLKAVTSVAAIEKVSSIGMDTCRSSLGGQACNRSMAVVILFGLILITWGPACSEAAWTAKLEDGGTVRVDPRTKRATVIKNGVETQLWDGVHRLRDGSTLIVESGQAVPTEEIYEAREQPVPLTPPEEGRGATTAEEAAEQGTPMVGGSPCQRLVRRSCGPEDRCGQAQGCDLARQLLDMEREERRRGSQLEKMTFTSRKCAREFNNFELFPLCQDGKPGDLK